MKALFATLLLAGLCCATAVAAESGEKVPFAQKKAEILQHLAQRITRIQAEQACVQAATSHAELKACKAKFQEERKAARQAKEQGNRL